MAISSETRRAGPYLGTGSVTVFPFSFKLLDPEHVKVVVSTDGGLTDSTLSSTAYTVALNADQDNYPGGAVTLVEPLADGHTLSILSNAPYAQNMTLTRLGGFYPSILNDNADSLEIQIQQIYEQVVRSVKVPAAADKTAEELAAELLSAQSDARIQADAASASAEAAKASEEATAAYAEAAKVIAPHADGIQAVADNIDSVVNVGSSLDEVRTVAFLKDDISSIGENLSDVLTVADQTNLDAYRIVAGIRNEVVNVAGISTDVVTVSGISDAVSAVATNIDGVTTVYGSIDEVNVIAADIVGGGTLQDGFKGGSITEEVDESTEIAGGVIKAVADNISDVHTVASNIGTIIASPENAAAAAASASSSSTSASAAAKSESSAAQHQTNAAQSATLSQAWAVQTTAPVEGGLYGAKYYAEKAASTASEVADVTQSLVDEGDAQRRSISTAGASAVSNVNAARDEAVVAIGTAESSAVSAVGTAETSAISSVNSAKSTAITEIGSTASSKKTELETIAGMYYTPSVTSDGVLSWTNNGGKENPDAVDIKGPRGDTGLGFVIKAQYADYDTFIAAHPTGSEGDNYQMADTGEIWIWDVEALAWKNIGKMRGSSANEVPMETDPTTYYETLFSGFGDLVATAEA